MADYATLNLRIKNNKFNQAIDQSSSKLGMLGSAAMKIGGVMAGMFAAKKIYDSAKELVIASSNATETANKFHTVFSGIGKGADIMSAKFAKDFGLADVNAQQLLASTGDLLTGFGFTDKSAAQLSDKVNRLAGDLASFQNIPIKQASEALTKAMLGEAESAKLLGIQINQNTPHYKELVKYYQEAEGKTLAQAKALTALKMAQEQSGKAIGDRARTESSLANVIKDVGQAWENLKIKMGKVVVAGLNIKEIMQSVLSTIKSATSVISAIGPETASAIMEIGALAVGYVTVTTAAGAYTTVLNIKAAAQKMATVSTVEDTVANEANATSIVAQSGASMGLAGKMGALKGALGKVGMIGAAAFVGWKIGRAIGEATGLDKALTKLYGNWYYNHRKLLKEGKNLDKKLQEWNKKHPLNGRHLAKKPKNAENVSNAAKTPILTEKEKADQKRIADIQKSMDNSRFEHELSRLTVREKILKLQEKETQLYKQGLNTSDSVTAKQLYAEAQRVKFRKEDLQYQQKIKNQRKLKEELEKKQNEKPVELAKMKSFTGRETSLASAVEKGSMDALKLASTSVSRDDKMLKKSAETAKYTKQSSKVLDKIYKKISKNVTAGGSMQPVDAFA